MNAVTPMHWAVRSPCWVYLFGELMLAGGVMAFILSFWPLAHEQWAVRGLGVLIVVLASVHIFVSRRHRGAAHAKRPRLLSRIATNHWCITYADGEAVEGPVCRVWQGWGWTTLAVQLHASTGRAQTVTVWRGNVSAMDWHHLQVWTTWELAMVTLPGRQEAQW